MYGAGNKKSAPSTKSSVRQIVLAVIGAGLLGIFVVFMVIRQSSDPAASLLLHGDWKATYRIFSPLPDDYEGDSASFRHPAIPQQHSENYSFKFYTLQEQRDFLVQFGTFCQRGFVKDNVALGNVVLEAYDRLPGPYARELWKFCVLYTGVGNVYWEMETVSPLTLWEDVVVVEDAKDKKMNVPESEFNFAIQMESEKLTFELAFKEKLRLHHGLVRVAKPTSKVCLGMIRHLVQTPALDPVTYQETFGLFVNNDSGMNMAPWKFFPARCIDTSRYGQTNTKQLLKRNLVVPKTTQRTGKHGLGRACTMVNNGDCCQVWRNVGDDWPILTVRHPTLTSLRREDLEPSRPYLYSTPEYEDMEMEEKVLAMAPEEIPFLATVRSIPTGEKPSTAAETPNFFDILLQNNCLPHDKDCFRCLKTGYAPDSVGGNCDQCRDACPCYCSVLCQIRPPKKTLTAQWIVSRPKYRRDPTRLVPRILHQTWYEPVTKEGYPNMSRLMESFRQSGWQFEFYDDARAAQFLSAHFPPEVREAYDAVIPGAFKADLFRYCVLLIRGGVYADMDILLESNLDEIIDPTLGYAVPQDSPGMTMGHRHCLWNGLMAAVPGHPFLAQTIELVVNNIRNRFTSVDYDDMLCPDPVLAVAHTVDTLFTCGPCILGAGMNDVLNRHRQTGFDYGEIDLFQTELKRGSTTVDPDDPRLLIEGRALIWKQNKQDMGSHRFTDFDQNAIVAVTDMPKYDDRPKSLEHYSKTHEQFGIYGLNKLYINSERANEYIRIRVDP